MNPVSHREKARDAKGNEVLKVEYLGKTMRANVMLGSNQNEMDNSKLPDGAEIQINMILDRAVVAKEVREMLDEAKSGNQMLFMCRTFNIRKDVLSALGFVEGAITA
ncbi:hypothetical protein CJF40_09065 [Pseudomonas lundensis]|uniref:hypothetical protein n=1 Tax=Pseudomonas lundensis TaxID=86185 RepID=UPI000BA26067|nr:hypothetical protein [Pseudomonas lundensis]NNA32734.1 hypothetical protein [Pseudomonas lundensis]OZY28461.1 hypothetical protein CJF40_09065 [Pseudomonas lundensis]